MILRIPCWWWVCDDCCWVVHVGLLMDKLIILWLVFSLRIPPDWWLAMDYQSIERTHVSSYVYIYIHMNFYIQFLSSISATSNKTTLSSPVPSLEPRGLRQVVILAQRRWWPGKHEPTSKVASRAINCRDFSNREPVNRWTMKHSAWTRRTSGWRFRKCHEEWLDHQKWVVKEQN